MLKDPVLFYGLHSKSMDFRTMQSILRYQLLHYVSIKHLHCSIYAFYVKVCNFIFLHKHFTSMRNKKEITNLWDEDFTVQLSDGGPDKLPFDVSYSLKSLHPFHLIIQWLCKNQPVNKWCYYINRWQVINTMLHLHSLIVPIEAILVCGNFLKSDSI